MEFLYAALEILRFIIRLRPFFWLWFGLMILDVVSGYSLAIKTKDVDSTVMREGLWRKANVLIMLLVVMAFEAAAVPGAPVSELVAMQYAWYEGNSLIENLGRQGFWVPATVKKVFAKLKDLSEVPGGSNDRSANNS